MRVRRTIACPFPVLSGCAVALLPFAGADSAFAQQLEEVIITTARQREEALQDVPATVTAITAESIEAAAVQRAGDFIRLTPGVSLVQAAEVADAQVNIRGINGARDAENSFALVVDGILQTNPAVFNREYADLQQIEILKGPQGALYGRNAAAGAIIVTTRRPGDELAGELKASGGEDSTYVAQLTMGGPLSAGVKWKLQGDYRDTEGFYPNRFLGGDKNVDDFQGWNVNARLLFEPSDTTQIDLKAHYGEVDAASISFNAAFQLPAFTLAPLPNAALFNEDVNDHNFDFVNNLDPTNEQTAKDLSVKLEADFGWGTLTAWTLYSDVENAFGADGTSGAFGFFFADAQCIATSAAVFNAMFQLPPPTIQFAPPPQAAIFGPYSPTACDGTQWQERNQTDYSFELRLTSPGEQRLRWLTGLYYLNIEREVGVNTGIDRGQGILPTLFAPAGSANPTEALVWDEFNSDIYAVFGNVAFDATEQVELALALRYDREEREVTNLVPRDARTQYIDFTPDGNPTGGAFLNPALDPVINPSGVRDQERTFSQVQPKVSVTWEPSDALTLYANWGIGFKSGGFNNQGSSAIVDVFINCLTDGANIVTTPAGPADGPCLPGQAPARRTAGVRDQFEKEKSSAAEIGVKSQLLDGRVQLEAAVYNTDVDDLQFFEFIVGQFGLLRVVNNVDEVNIRGLELAGTARLTDELTLVAGYSRVQSEIEKITVRPNALGNESPYTPDYTATAGIALDMPVSAGGWRLQASSYWNLVGPTWFHVIQGQDNPSLQGNGFVPANYTNSERDKYQTIDARIAVASDAWTVALIGKNITDEKFLQEVIPAVEFGGDFIHPGTQRRWALEVGYRF